MAEPTWYWDANVGRYRTEAGAFIAKQKVLGYVVQGIETSSSAADTLAHYVAGGYLNVADWNAAFKQELKEEYIRQYLLGKGGTSQMARADWGRIGGMLADQYRYLDGFYDEVLSGTLSEEAIAARMRMYVNSAREAFERAQAQVAKATDKTEERWVLGIAENCSDCLGLEAMGWVPIGTLPMPGAGSTQCLTNCRCHKEYR